MFRRIAGLTWRRPRSVLAAFGVLAVVAAVFAHDVESHLQAAGFTDPASESERATQVLRDALGADPNPAMVFLISARDGGRLDLTRPAVRREVERLSRAVAAVPEVGRVDDPLRDPAARDLLADDGRSLVLAAHLTTQDVEDEGGRIAEDARGRVRSASLSVAMAGYAPAFNDVNDQTRKDLTNAELIAFPALTILLLLVFRGVIAAALPLLVGVLSILGTFLVLRTMSLITGTSLFALNISTALSLGLAVDYALLIVSRYREELERHGPGELAHRNTVMTAGRTAVFSGLTVAAAMAALTLMPQRFLYSIGAAGAAVGLLSAATAILVLPSLLALLGPRVNALSVRRGPAVSAGSGGWHRLARAVMRRPVLIGGAAALLLVTLASPSASTTLVGPSAEVVPPGQPTYAPLKTIEAHYPRSVSEAVTVAVRGAATPAQLASLDRRMAAVPGVSARTPFTGRGDVRFANLALDGPALSARSQDAVRAIRDLPAPPGTEVLVAGNTARFLDLKASLAHHAPLVLGVLAAGTLLLLFALTGSILLPLKTLLMNALTLAATVGVLVVGFQHGWLEGLVADTGPDAIEVISLVFLAAITFALATDYAVLVIARIKEHHDAGVPNADAVAAGIGATGRIISAAAVMIAVVFLAFAVSPVFFMKQIAVGMAVGVLIDATIVRALLVPALMRLLGEWNWWAPAPLARLQRRWGLREEPAASA